MAQQTKIIVTGSSGRIGSAIAHELEKVFGVERVLGLDRTPGKHTRHVFDLRNSTRLAPLVADATVVCHCAALHAPHVSTHSQSDFIDINVGVTEALLRYTQPDTHFVFTSSTSIYGHALVPEGERGEIGAVWVDETLRPLPRDIYDQTKLAAETRLKESGRSVISLRMSRCFPEPEREMALYRLYRGVDIRDVVSAHLLAVNVGLADLQSLNHTRRYREYIVSGPTPFLQQDSRELLVSPWSCIRRYFPQAHKEFARRNWAPPESIDRVYSSQLATTELGYKPLYGFAEFLFQTQ